jgi:hypothetical protein
MRTASAATTTTAASEGASTTSAGVGARRTRFVYGQTAALQRLAIESSNGSLHVLAISQFDESEAPRLACHLVANDYGGHCLNTRSTDELLEFGIRYLVGKIPHEQLLRHEILPMERRSPGIACTL